MKKILFSRQRALKIAIEYLGIQFEGELDISDPIPGKEMPYIPNNEEYWIIYVPSRMPIVGASRHICISKSTGQILFDGFIGE